MGIMDKVQKPNVVQPSNKLTLQEYEFLFWLIKNSTFKGEQLEMVYGLTVKLQEEYLTLKEKQGNN